MKNYKLKKSTIGESVIYYTEVDGLYVGNSSSFDLEEATALFNHYVRNGVPLPNETSQTETLIELNA